MGEAAEVSMFGNGSVGAQTALILAALAAPAPAADSAGKPLSRERCEQLIGQLVNPGKQPFAKNYVRRLPDGVTESGLIQAQRPIKAAYDELSANIGASLPLLVGHLGDRRFSYVYEDGISGVYQCQTVGGACARILQAHVDVYRKPVTIYDEEGRSTSLRFDYDEHGGFVKWWKDRRRRSLAELQLEKLEWAMDRTKPDYFSEREWAAAKESLEQVAENIRSSKEPFRVEHKVQFFSR